MTQELVLLHLGVWAIAAPAGLYLLHRLALRLEARGCLYYRNRKPTGGGVTNAALELDRLLSRPSVEHHIVAEDDQVKRSDNDGA